jgi:hypothetical protein
MPPASIGRAVIATLAAAGALGLATAARADYVFNLTELSDTDLSVSLSLPDYSLTETNIGSGDFWVVGPVFGGIPLLYPFTPDRLTQTYVIGWIEPGGSMRDLANARFNILGVAPSGNRGNTQFSVQSDRTYGQFLDASYQNCGVGGAAAPCPILNNGETFDLPFYRPGNPDVFSTLAVTFRDRGDTFSDAPEPAAWALTLTGFAAAGAALRRRPQGRVSLRRG